MPDEKLDFNDGILNARIDLRDFIPFYGLKHFGDKAGCRDVPNYLKAVMGYQTIWIGAFGYYVNEAFKAVDAKLKIAFEAARPSLEEAFKAGLEQLLR
jgi:hypothetical protein